MENVELDEKEVNSLIDFIICQITGCFSDSQLRRKRWAINRKIKRDIKENLLNLKPSKTVDNATGYIAYSVTKDRRMKSRIGRFLTKKLELNNGFLSDNQIEKIRNNISLHLYPDFIIRLDKGKKITENYKNSIGVRSCMCGNYSEYTKLYESNPDRFQQLIMISGDNSARAIVHKLDSGDYLMDRVYSDSVALEKKMVEYAKKQNWIWKYDNIKISSWIVSNLNYKDGEVPYMDTLYNGIIKNGKLTIFGNGVFIKGSILDLRSTEGTIEGLYRCENCGEHYDDDELVYSEILNENYCDSCFWELHTQCDYCGEVALEENVVFISGYDNVCENCLDGYFIRCDDCNEFIESEKSYNVTDVKKEVCIDCLSDYYQCKDCGEYFSELNEHNFCEDCENNHIFCVECKMEVDSVNDIGECEECQDKSQKVLF